MENGFIPFNLSWWPNHSLIVILLNDVAIFSDYYNKRGLRGKELVIYLILNIYLY